MKEDIQNIARNYLLFKLKSEKWLYEGKPITSYYSVNQDRYSTPEAELESFVNEAVGSYINTIKGTDDILIFLKPVVVISSPEKMVRYLK